MDLAASPRSVILVQWPGSEEGFSASRFCTLSRNWGPKLQTSILLVISGLPSFEIQQVIDLLDDKLLSVIHTDMRKENKNPTQLVGRFQPVKFEITPRGTTFDLEIYG